MKFYLRLFAVFFLSLCVLLPITKVAAKNYGNFENVEYLKSVDGDTFKVNIPDVHDLLGKEVNIRVRDIDAPEIQNHRVKCDKEKVLGEAAKEFLDDLLTNSKSIDLLKVDRGKFFVIEADVTVDGLDLAAVLTETGHAKYWDGKNTSERPNWCRE
jgi:endonuclease YncB( thermonuclease family)